jgi:hypothetical protein
VLIDDGANVYPASIHVTRVTAIGPHTDWYPYGAGAFGAEMMI